MQLLNQNPPLYWLAQLVGCKSLSLSVVVNFIPFWLDMMSLESPEYPVKWMAYLFVSASKMNPAYSAENHFTVVVSISMRRLAGDDLVSWYTFSKPNQKLPLSDPNPDLNTDHARLKLMRSILCCMTIQLLTDVTGVGCGNVGIVKLTVWFVAI